MSKKYSLVVLLVVLAVVFWPSHKTFAFSPKTDIPGYWIGQIDQYDFNTDGNSPCYSSSNNGPYVTKEMYWLSKPGLPNLNIDDSSNPIPATPGSTIDVQINYLTFVCKGNIKGTNSPAATPDCNNYNYASGTLFILPCDGTNNTNQLQTSYFLKNISYANYNGAPQIVNRNPACSTTATVGVAPPGNPPGRYWYGCAVFSIAIPNSVPNNKLDVVINVTAINKFIDGTDHNGVYYKPTWQCVGDNTNTLYPDDLRAYALQNTCGTSYENFTIYTQPNPISATYSCSNQTVTFTYPNVVTAKLYYQVDNYPVVVFPAQQPSVNNQQSTFTIDMSSYDQSFSYNVKIGAVFNDWVTVNSVIYKECYKPTCPSPPIDSSNYGFRLLFYEPTSISLVPTTNFSTGQAINSGNVGWLNSSMSGVLNYSSGVKYSSSNSLTNSLSGNLKFILPTNSPSGKYSYVYSFTESKPKDSSNNSFVPLSISISCSTNGQTSIYNAPYFKVFGGGIMSGSTNINNGSCSASNQFAGLFGFNTSDSSGAYFGSSSSEANIPFLNDIGVASYHNDIETINKYPNKLTFANDSVTLSANAYGGSFGTSFCIPDYYSNFKDSAASKLTINPSSNHIGSYPTPNSYQNVYAYDSADVYIDNSIVLTGNPPITGWPTPSRQDMPFLFIIAKGKNIYISNNATEIDANLIAIPDQNGSGGNVYTCSEGLPFSNSTKVFSTCGNRLVIKGSVTAKNLYLMRARGSMENDAGNTDCSTSPLDANASEIICFSPASWIINPYTSTNGNSANNIDYLQKLPPVL